MSGEPSSSTQSGSYQRLAQALGGQGLQGLQLAARVALQRVPDQTGAAARREREGQLARQGALARAVDAEHRECARRAARGHARLPAPALGGDELGDLALEAERHLARAARELARGSEQHAVPDGERQRGAARQRALGAAQRGRDHRQPGVPLEQPADAAAKGRQHARLAARALGKEDQALARGERAVHRRQALRGRSAAVDPDGREQAIHEPDEPGRAAEVIRGGHGPRAREPLPRNHAEQEQGVEVAVVIGDDEALRQRGELRRALRVQAEERAQQRTQHEHVECGARVHGV